MNCCGLSSTGLKNIQVDANEITTDDITIFSNLNVSGYSFFNNTSVDNNSHFLSSLNVNGYTTLNNNTIINAPLYVSGLNILQKLIILQTI